MTKLNLDLFNPKKAELVTLTENVKDLKINGIDDVEGYEKVKVAQKELQQTRLDIKKKGKEAREEALSYQKGVIVLENELLEVIVPVEKQLKDKRDGIDEMKRIEKRKKSLPDRLLRLLEIEIQGDATILLGMDDKQFNEYFYDEKAKYVDAKEEKDRLKHEDEQAKIDADKKDIQDEKDKIANAKLIEEEKEKSKKTEKLNGRTKRLEDLGMRRVKNIFCMGFDDCIENVIEIDYAILYLEDADFERIFLQTKNDVDGMRKKSIEIATKKKLEEEANIKAKNLLKEQEKFKKKKKMQEFLVEHGYSEENKDDFKMVSEGNKISLFKKVGEITI